MHHVLNSSAKSFSARHGGMHSYAEHRRDVELHVHHQKPAPERPTHDHLCSCRHARRMPKSLRRGRAMVSQRKHDGYHCRCLRRCSSC